MQSKKETEGVQHRFFFKRRIAPGLSIETMHAAIGVQHNDTGAVLCPIRGLIVMAPELLTMS